MDIKAEIDVFNTKVRVVKIDDADYICITDLARYKNPESPDAVIRSWLNTKRELEFLQEWESAYNPDFKTTTSSSFRGFKEYVVEVFLKNLSSVGKWISYTNAKGIITKKGRYGGTYAHSTIALNFANYIHAKFYIRVLEEYQVLKQNQAALLGDPLDIKRNLTAGNYSLLVSAIFSQIDERLLSGPQPYTSRLPQAAEADLLNEIVFGTTAKQWRLANPDKPKGKNMRDYASILDLVILNNLQFLDAMLLLWGCEMDERKSLLTEAYEFQYPTLKRSKTIKRMQELADRATKQ
jgi:hypothetical protein